MSLNKVVRSLDSWRGVVINEVMWGSMLTMSVKDDSLA